jgi:hypothetical protein
LLGRVLGRERGGNNRRMKKMVVRGLNDFHSTSDIIRVIKSRR